MERGIKRVPRKIKDFSGCLKGVRLINNLSFRVVDYGGIIVYRGEVRGTEKYTLDISCIVLAGGKGLRLGRDKVQESVGDRNLLQLVLSKLSSFNNDIIVVTAGEKSLSQLVGYPRFRIVTDTYRGKGALGGIYTGLAASGSLYNLVVACDMPFLNQALLRYMIQLSAGFDLVIPRVGELTEPLHAVYSKRCLAPIERLLNQGELRVSTLFGLVKVRYVEAEEIDWFDPKHLSLFNINTEADLEKAQQLATGDMSYDKC
jgi:molybdopterin-guanine dinucleotide biosynthesis protein A